MGQGTLTGLAQLVAEELDADWDKVTWEYPTPGQNVARDRVWGAFGTYGSQGIRAVPGIRPPGRRRGARHAAAGRGQPLGRRRLDPDRREGRHHRPGRRDPDATASSPPRRPSCRCPRAWRSRTRPTWTIAGQPLKRLDTADKLDGSQIYSHRRHACPAWSTPRSGRARSSAPRSRASTPRRSSGCPASRRWSRSTTDAVAVVADTWWRAKTALDALPIEWNETASTPPSRWRQVHAMLDEGLSAEEAFVGNQTGDVQAALDGAAQVVEADYYFPWQHHATMEPMNATALVTADSCEVWTATQDAEADLAVASEASRPRRSRKCEVHRLSLGGGFGRRALSRTTSPQQAVLHRDGDAGHARQAHLVARGGHAPRHLPSDHQGADARRARRGGQPDRAAHAHLRPVDRGGHHALRACRTGWTRSSSRASTPRATRASSATPCRTC